MWDYKADPKVVFQKTYINPAYRRYELRRVGGRCAPEARLPAPGAAPHVLRRRGQLDLVDLTTTNKDDKVEDGRTYSHRCGRSADVPMRPFTMWALQAALRDRLDVDRRPAGHRVDQARRPGLQSSHGMKPDFYTAETLRFCRNVRHYQEASLGDGRTTTIEPLGAGAPAGPTPANERGPSW